MASAGWGSSAPASGVLPSGRNTAANPGTSLSSENFSAERRAWLRVTGEPSRANRIAAASRRSSGSLPPKACAASSASIHPATAPGTVSAASGPRGGISS